MLTGTERRTTVMNLLRGLLFLLVSLLLGELVKRILTSGIGEAAASRLGRPHLSTLEGATAASQEVRRVVGFVRSLTDPKPPIAETLAAAPRVAGWVGIALDAAELFLAAGALLKVAAEFAGDNETLQQRISRAVRR
jgi:hypothetical protein